MLSWFAARGLWSLAVRRLNRTDIRSAARRRPRRLRATHNACMQVRSYLKLSVAVALATIALKFGAWWLTGSVGLLSDALESLVNLAGAVFALMMVTVAAAPPDEDHPYGHHKAEYFSSGFEGVLILAAAVAHPLGRAVDRFVDPQPLQSVDIGLALSVISSVLNGALAVAMLQEGARAPFDGARGRRAPSVHRRLDFGGRGAGGDGGGAHRLAVARPGDRDRGGAEHHARGRAPAVRHRPMA